MKKTIILVLGMIFLILLNVVLLTNAPIKETTTFNNSTANISLVVINNEDTQNQNMDTQNQIDNQNKIDEETIIKNY